MSTSLPTAICLRLFLACLMFLLVPVIGSAQDDAARKLPTDNPIQGPGLREEGAPGDGPIWKEDSEKVIEGLKGLTPPDQYMNSLRDLGVLDELANRTSISDDKSTTQWSRIGPVGGFGSPARNGRIAGIQFLDDGGSYWLYAGSCQGGLWRVHSTSLFQWQDIGRNLPNPSVRGFAVDPDNFSHIFVGTGDHVRFSGAGLFETTNAGVTWNQVGLPWLNTPDYFYRVEYLGNDPTSGQKRMVAVCSFGPIYSADGGSTWQTGKDLVGGEISGVWSDLVRHPTNPGELFAVRCSPNGNGGSGIYFSNNYGETWLHFPVGGLPSSDDWDRASLAICRSNPSTLAVLISTGAFLQGVYKTTNSGGSWSNITNELIDSGTGYSFGGDQIIHAQAIAIHPDNPDNIFVAGVGLATSDDGGATWEIGQDENGIEPGHADFTQIVFAEQTGSNFAWFCNDGGIYYHSLSGAATYSANGNTSTGLACSEVDFLDAKGSMVGIGLQDNGVLLSTDAGSTWDFLASADGADIEIFDPFSGDLFYNAGMFGGSNSWRTFRKFFGGSATFTNNPPKYMPRLFWSPAEEKMWTTDATALHSLDPNGALTWVEEYSDWGPADSSVRSFWGTYTRDSSFWIAYWENKTTGQNGEDLTYVYKQNGTWTQKHHDNFNPTGNYVLTVTPSRQWPDEAWVGLRAGAGNPKIFHVLNGGDTAIDITGNLTSVNEVRTIEVMPFNPRVIWAGTDLGVFQTTDGGVTWAPFMDGLPIGKSSELKFVEDATHSGTHKLLLAIDGRGVWSRDVTLPPIIFVDSRVSTSGTGSRWDPIQTIAAGVAAAPAGSIIAIHTDEYGEPQTLSKNVQMVTWGGDTIIK